MRNPSGAEKSQQCHKYFINLPWKELICPGRHLTSLRPCLHQVLVNLEFPWLIKIRLRTGKNIHLEQPQSLQFVSLNEKNEGSSLYYVTLVKFDVEKQFSLPQKCKSTSHVGTGHCVTCIERAIECGGSNRANLVSEESSVVILGFRSIFARIFPNLPEKNPKKVLHAVLGAIFSNQSMLGAIFAHIFRVFPQIFRDFVKVFKDFAQISTKSKLLGVRLLPRLPHQCLLLLTRCTCRTSVLSAVRSQGTVSTSLLWVLQNVLFQVLRRKCEHVVLLVV